MRRLALIVALLGSLGPLAGCSAGGAQDTTTPEVLTTPTVSRPFRAERSRAARATAAAVGKNERDAGRIESVGCMRIKPDTGFYDWDCRVDFAERPPARCRTPGPNRYGVVEVSLCRGEREPLGAEPGQGK